MRHQLSTIPHCERKTIQDICKIPLWLLRHFLNFLKHWFLISFFQTSMNVWARQAHAKGARCALTQLAPTHARGTQSTVVEDTTSTRRGRAVSVKAPKKPLHHKTNPVNKSFFHLARGLASFRRYRWVQGHREGLRGSRLYQPAGLVPLRVSDRLHLQQHQSGLWG